MAQRSGKKKQARSGGQAKQAQQGTPKKEPFPVRKVFTVVICVLVALSLMLPVTGISMASCSSAAQTQQP
ncbi:MAG: hypothetical protein LBH64_01845 [Coriobacteriales bacterium]|jgi:ABC-type Fe3+ transport system permease subunit|nr:hypothetical protein [Coriobacteriales bacterium]